MRNWLYLIFVGIDYDFNGFDTVYMKNLNEILCFSSEVVVFFVAEVLFLDNERSQCPNVSMDGRKPI